MKSLIYRQVKNKKIMQEQRRIVKNAKNEKAKHRNERIWENSYKLKKEKKVS